MGQKAARSKFVDAKKKRQYRLTGRMVNP